MPEPTKSEIDNWKKVVANGSDRMVAKFACNDWQDWRHDCLVAEFKRRALTGAYDKRNKLTDAQAMLLMDVTT